MQHNRCSTLLGRRQRSKQALTALSTSGSVAKYRLCVARRLVSFQTRSIGASCGLYRGRNTSRRCRTWRRKNGAKAGDGLAGRRMLQDRVLDFGRYPHATARTVLLEVTFIQTPQFDVGTASQTTEFFLLPRLSADLIERLAGAACVTESPVVEIVAGIVARANLLCLPPAQ